MYCVNSQGSQSREQLGDHKIELSEHQHQLGVGVVHFFMTSIPQKDGPEDSAIIGKGRFAACDYAQR